MRIMIYTNGRPEIDFLNEISKLEENMCTKIDFFDDYEDAEYCMDTRNYDLVIFEYNKDKNNKYYNFLGYLKKKEIQPKTYIFGKDLSYSKTLLETSKFVEIIDNYNFNIEDIISKNTTNIIEEEEIKIDINNKKIFIKGQEVEFKKTIDFYVLLYFMRHYKSTLNIQSILSATCTDPEYSKDSLIESSISSIRSLVEGLTGINPIKAFKKIGYRFSLEKK